MGILKHKTSIAFIMGLALIASISPALAQDLSPITTMLTTIGTTLTGPLGHAAGLIAVCAIGLAFMTGRMNWPLATSIVLGLVILFGAAEILAGIA